MYEFAVIGKGLIGSAAFRHLAGRGRTIVIGPDEPADPGTHRGVFGAHHDQARLTHQHGKSPVWGELGRRSFAAYDNIADRSGIGFHSPVGELFVADPGADNSYHQPANIENSRRVLGLDLVEFDANGLASEFGFLAFPPDAAILLERGPAGHINPRRLIEAQLAIAKADGGEVLAETVVGVTPTADGSTLMTDAGTTITARRVLVAAGAFSNANNLLAEPLDLTLKTETVVFGRIDPAEAERLSTMPVIHYDLTSEQLANIYAIGPVLYPDGHHYLKLGANTVGDTFPKTAAEMSTWYATGNSGSNLDALRSALVAMVPDARVEEWSTGRCVITRTPKAFPIIDEVVEGRVYTAVGGNGSSAYCSDALGALAAGLVATGEWNDELDREQFRA